MTLPHADWPQHLALLEDIPDGVMVLDGQGTLLGVNAALARITGLTPAELVGRPLTHLEAQGDADHASPAFPAEDWLAHCTRRVRCRWQHADGTRINVEISLTPCDEGHVCLAFVRDITDLVSLTSQLRRTQNFHEFLIAANTAVARADTPDALYRQICHLATNFDQRLVLVWIGLIDAASQVVSVVAASGPAQASLDDLDLQHPPADSLLRRCLHQQQLVISDPAAGPEAPQPTRPPDIVAQAALPFRCAGRPAGVLMLCSSTSGIFDADLARLLTELGDSISLALDYFAQREEIARNADALRRSESQYRLLADNIRDVIWVMDIQQQRFTYISRSVEKLCGYTAEEMLTKPMSDILSPESARNVAHWTELDLAAWRAGTYQARTAEVEQICRDGHSIWVEVATQLVPQDQQLYLYGVSRDVSSRRAAEHQFREIVGLATEGVAMVDASGLLILVNAPLCAMLGYREEALLGRSIQELLHPDDAQRFARNFAEVTQGLHKETRNARYALLHQDGHRLDVILSASHRFDSEGRYLGSVGMMTDISPLVATENELRQHLARQQDLNSRLEDAHNQLLQSEKMASIGQLAAGVAHELNNPIGFVHSNLGTLDHYLTDIFAIADAYEKAEAEMGTACPHLDTVRRLKKQKDYDYLRQDIGQLMVESKEGLNRVRKIVQDLKDFSRVGDTQWQWADLHQGLDSTLNIVWNELKYRCTVDKHYAPDLPKIYCLPSQLNQVFMNLLVNAAHAMENHDNRLGTITLGTRQMDAKTVELSFADNGKGIPADQLKRIFEPFFTTKAVGRGTGLGLSIAWGIIGRHHGHIDVTSTPGQGTTFTLTLPIHPDSQADGAADAVPPAPTFAGPGPNH